METDNTPAGPDCNNNISPAIKNSYRKYLEVMKIFTSSAGRRKSHRARGSDGSQICVVFEEIFLQFSQNMLAIGVFSQC